MAQYARPKIAEGVGLAQKLNAPVPLDLVFQDENNQTVPLRTYFGDKPVVLELVYFTCTSLCPMTLMESVSSLKRVSLEPGRDYNVVVVSIDPHDTPAKALEEKSDYAALFGQKPVRSVAGFQAGWHFLTGHAGIDFAAGGRGGIPLSLGRGFETVRPRGRHHGRDAGRQAFALLLWHAVCAA